VRLHALRSSVLLLEGANEGPPAQRYASRLARTFRHYRRVPLEGAGALSLLERPDQAAAAIEAHLRAATPAAAVTSGGVA
jgi:hypothetical protein